MKKTWKWMLFALFLLTALSGCSNEEKAQERFNEYANLWNKQDFSAMYEYLSAQAKKDISKKEFTERYKKIYEGIEVKNLKVDVLKLKEDLKEKDGMLPLSFDLKMETMAGPVDFTQEVTWVKEKQQDKKNWFIEWNHGMVFPDLKEDDKVKVSILKGVRGEILDRRGNFLAQNGTAAQIGIVPGKLGEKAADTKQKLSKLLNISVQTIEKKLGASWVKEDLLVPVKTVSLRDETIIKSALQYPGVQVSDIPARVYPCQEACAHLVGYVAPITADLLDKHKDGGYTAQSVIGHIGLEGLYESDLRARDGAVIYISDSEGNTVKEIAKKEAVNGQDMQLTIDSLTQRILYEQLQNEVGTAAAIHPANGDVLGLVSSPSFNPNDFSFGIDTNTYQSLANNPNQPLLNRFTKTFSPGSTFKLITAGLILDNHVVTPETSIPISGKWQKDSSWGGFYVNRVGSLPTVNLHNALVTSDNIYFARTAVELGIDKFQKGVQTFGFGEGIPLDYPFAKSQISNSGQIESEILLANSAYGQGEIQMNPLHLALVYSSIVNEGDIVAPRLIKEENTEREIWKKQAMTPQTAQIVQNGLIGIIEDPNGTAHEAKITGMRLAGKTGTSELKQTQGEKGEEKGWFVAVDTNNPNLLIAMMIDHVENRGGSHYVVPKVRQVFEQHQNTP
ncbi:penicillin-binding transpeptidase domain-containing protein [Priestia abyssalis]|uniref:penicillin-binding transpeptidase domain-containing protein n=1 Tax=Priestia abyssalis TaxID=1221450 RepID=UPI0009950C37|nr:penicillin-binding transpeptidase domain-containing protein [Priestia abyssalis]